MLKSLNSMAAFVAVVCAALNMGVSSTKANTFQSTLSDHLSSGAILLAEDDTGDLLSGTDSSDDSTTAGNSGDTDKSATHSADDIDVNDVGTPRAGATAATNDEEGDKDQTTATDNKPKDESKDASAAAEGDKSQTATTEAKPAEEKPAQEKVLTKEEEDKYYADHLKGVQSETKAVEEQMASDPNAAPWNAEVLNDYKAAMDKTITDFKQNHPDATPEQVEKFFGDVQKASNEYSQAVMQKRIDEVPALHQDRVTDADQRIWQFQFDYFKQHPDEASQAAQKVILANPDLMGAGVEGSKEEQMKQFHDFKAARDEFFQKKEEEYQKQHGK